MGSWMGLNLAKFASRVSRTRVIRLRANTKVLPLSVRMSVKTT